MNTQNNLYKAAVFDTETHHADNPRIVEAAYAPLSEDGNLIAQHVYCERFNPNTPISLGAMATHFICDEDVADKPDYRLFKLPDWVTYVVGHNVSFDLGAIGNPEKLKAIDTLNISRTLWPDAENHKQSTLCLHITQQNGGNMKEVCEIIKGAHSAEVDIHLCAYIFAEQVHWFNENRQEILNIIGDEHDTFSAMHEISMACAIPMIMTFGKHVGEHPWDLPYSYKSWYQKLPDADPGIVLSMNRGAGNPEDEKRFATAMAIANIAQRNTEKHNSVPHP